MNLEKDKKLTLEELFYKQKELRQYMHSIDPKTDECKKLTLYLAETVLEYNRLICANLNDTVPKTDIQSEKN